MTDIKVIDTGDEAIDLTNETGLIQEFLLLMLNYGEALPYTENRQVLPITTLLVGASNTPMPGVVSHAFNLSLPSIDNQMRLAYPTYDSTNLVEVEVLSRESIRLTIALLMRNRSPVLFERQFTFGKNND